ncbi:diacylglycerol/lipid kinase family protein [Dethiobacter alkaliphilus]|nr:diacylglycerol kinase family protein [Dethiobacter alkaliphilus]MCW3490454.1 diacylglycerol kinase family lipid kinase [Dethiobacter alkaliphilus]
MTAKVVLNPYSNRWNAKRRWPEAEAALKAAGVDFSLAVSDYHGQAVELARQAALEGFSPIIAAGGDGTIGEVVNGLALANGEEKVGRLGIMPLGTANDLVCNLGLPRDLPEAAKVIAAGSVQMLDVCKAGEKYFVNNSALGLEPYVSTIQQEIKWLKGIPRYLAAALKGIFANPKWEARVEWDDGYYEGPLTLISVGNAPRTGGLFFMAPHADPFDGKLTAVMVNKKTALGTLLLLPKAMSPKGTYIYAEGVQQIHTTRIRVRLKRLSPAHSDGELFPQEVDSLDYSILPGRLELLMP